MNFTVDLALIGWPLVALALCALLPPRRAVIAAVLVAWLFLPVAKYDLPGLPDWTKMTATCVGLLFGLLIFDLPRLAAFRPRWFDLPLAAWCLSPVASSLSNGLGLYVGLSLCLAQVVTWGLPYLLGRLYFGDFEGLRELAVGVFIGGLVYIPFCIYEVRMSPQLHAMVYGFHPTDFEHSFRFGGWRPTVFMAHGLMVGMWMSMATLVGAWLWMSGELRSIRGIALPWFLAPLLVTSILCKSTGSLILLGLGAAVLALLRYRSSALLYLLAALAPVYVGVRVTGLWSGASLVTLAEQVSRERAKSLQVRMENEDLLSEKALKRPLFGWGAWGRSRVIDESEQDISITDGLWIIEFGLGGFFGLGSMFAVFLAPIWALSKVPAEEWIRSAAGASSLATVVALYLLDCLSNAMINPIYMLAAGGISCLMLYRKPAAEPAAAVSES